MLPLDGKLGVGIRVAAAERPMMKVKRVATPRRKTLRTSGIVFQVVQAAQISPKHSV